MNYIKSVSGTNFKGQTFRQDLSPLTHISGRNFAGKTTRLDAIRLAIMGRHPRLSKTNADIFKLSSGPRMAVCVELDNGTQIQREYWQDGEAIKSAGADSGIITPLMDAREYFGLTATQRMDYIASRLEMTTTQQAAAIVAELKEKLKECDEDARNAVIEIVRKGLEKDGVADGLTNLTKKGGTLLAEFSTWNAKAKESIGAIRTLADLKAREGECSAETLDSLNEEIAGIQQELETAMRRQGELAQSAMQANKVRTRRGQLEAIINAVPRTIPLPQKPQINAKEVEELTTQALDLQKRLDDDYFPAPNDLADLQHDANQRFSERELADMASKRATDDIESKEAEIAEFAANKACSHCGHTIPKAKRDKMLKEMNGDLALLRVGAEAAQKIHADAVLAEREAEERLESAKGKVKERDELSTKLRSIQQRLDMLGRAQTDYEQAFKRATDRQAEENTDHAARVAEAKNELGELAEVEIDEQASTTAARVVRELRESLATAQASKDRAIKLQHDILRQTEAVQEHELAQAQCTAIKVAGAFLKERQADNIKGVFDTLLEKANYYTEDILRAPLAFHDGEVGMFVGGRFVYHDTFSGTEEEVAYVALAAALSETGKVRTVLVDEMGRMDKPIKERVLSRLLEAVNTKRIDQAIVIDVTPVIGGWWTSVTL